jgi:ATP-dependent Clp protease ATP-binding subunit ClpC
MSGFFDFIKKNNLNATQAQSPSYVQPPAYGTQQPVPVSNATVQTSVTQSTRSVEMSAGRRSYNGIGTPPGGSSYNGIGAPSQPAVTSTPPVNASVAVTSAPPAAPPRVTDFHAAASTGSVTTSVSASQKPSALDSHLSDTKRGDIDVMTHLTQRSNRVFLSANAKAKELKNTYVDSEHLLHGLLSDGEIYKLLVDLKIQPQMIEQELAPMYKKENSTTTPQMAPRIKTIIDNSLVTARKLGFEFISPEHILLSLFEEGEGVGARVLVKLGLKKEDLNKKILGKKEGLEATEKKEAESKKNMIDQYTVDLTAKAAQGLMDPVVERSQEIERIIHILSRRNKNNPALVGEAGVGKTAIVEGLAEKIVSKQVPESLLDKRILELDLMGILAGASHRGEFEERMKNLVDELKQSQGKIILFIDEIHTIVGAGSSGDNAIDASNFLKPALARGEIQLIGATTLTEYRKYIEKDPALERRFQPVVVPEPTEEQAVKMLKSTREKYEAFHKVKIPDSAVEAAVKLSKRYIGDRFLPDKAVDLLDEAASAVRLPLLSLPEEIHSLEERISELNQESVEASKAGDPVKARINKSKISDIEAELKEKKEAFDLKKAQTTTEVTESIIKDIVSRWTGIPVAKITGSEMERLANLEKIMHERMIGQETAVSAVAEAVRRGRAGLKSNQRPIGSFVFMGPTGVGKTELAKTLADVLFGQEEAMIRFDMTEYMEKHEVAKLLGAPPGYVGYEEGGKLTEAVRRKPYSVVLFDEVEKAHPDIFNILLQILDDGRLTDNKGHVISFKNTVVICTSNIGSVMIQDEMLKDGKVSIEEPPVLSTYTFSPRGRQLLTIGAKYFERDGEGTAWKDGMLLDYFSGQEVKMRLPEASSANASEASENKDRQEASKSSDFPIQGFDSHAISPQGIEMISKNGAIFYRTSTTAKEWEESTLIEFFKDNVVINALPDAPEEQLPTVKLKTHAFSTNEMEIVTFKDRFWRRKADSKDWETGLLKDYFAEQTAESVNGKAGTLPTDYWDIHAFTPAGREIIIVGEKVWFKDAQATVWKEQTLQEYFGTDFPLEKEIEAKQKVDQETDQKKYSLLKDKVLGELRKFFRPELINRFDEVIIFEPLKFSDMMKIVKLQLKSVGRLLEDQEMGFAFTDAAIKAIVHEGFDPVFGARPLRRAIQKLVENPISNLIIEGKLKPGDTVNVDFDGNNFVFDVERVEFVSAAHQAEEHTESFTCSVCNTTFETAVLPTATTVCKNCGSTKVVMKKDQTTDINQTQSSEPTPVVEPSQPNVQASMPPVNPTNLPDASAPTAAQPA